LIFGSSGVGNCHEYDSHNYFAGLPSATHPCWSYRSQSWVTVPLGDGPRNKVIFRNIDSIGTTLTTSSLTPRRYLLPSITNLALIDSIIPPNVVLQMTISDKHRGAVNRMKDIRKELGSPRSVKMIFVVPAKKVSKFTFPTDLPKCVNMYVTYIDTKAVVTLADAQKWK